MDLVVCTCVWIYGTWRSLTTFVFLGEAWKCACQGCLISVYCCCCGCHGWLCGSEGVHAAVLLLWLLPVMICRCVFSVTVVRDCAQGVHESRTLVIAASILCELLFGSEADTDVSWVYHGENTSNASANLIQYWETSSNWYYPYSTSYHDIVICTHSWQYTIPK